MNSHVSRTKNKNNPLSDAFFLLCFYGCASTDVEFNTDVLDAADRDNIDLTRFATDNYVPPGEYSLDIKINGQAVGQQRFAIWLLGPEAYPGLH